MKNESRIKMLLSIVLYIKSVQEAYGILNHTIPNLTVTNYMLIPCLPSICILYLQGWKAAMENSDEELFRELILRNAGYCENDFGMPEIIKEEFNLNELQLIGCHNIKKNDVFHKNCGVHFYKWDDKLERFYKNPQKYIDILKQYKFIFTPDYSIYICSNPNVQRFNVFRSRWVGNYYQRKGLVVYPGAGWGGKETFSWCFAGLPYNATLSISTLGTFREHKKAFLDGYFELLKQKKPENILCYGNVHREMEGSCNIISCLHEAEVINSVKEYEKEQMLYRNLLFNREQIYGKRA